MSISVSLKIVSVSALDTKQGHDGNSSGHPAPPRKWELCRSCPSDETAMVGMQV